MFEIIIDHLPEELELAVVTNTTGVEREPPARVVSKEDLISYQKLVRRVPVSEPVARYALAIVRASRPEANGKREFVRNWVSYGASVRAAQFIVLGGKARALTRGRFAVTYEDVRALAHPILRHRILANFQAQSEGISTDKLVDLLLESVPEPKSGM
jgi:MoxR-like ATPase